MVIGVTMLCICLHFNVAKAHRRTEVGESGGNVCFNKSQINPTILVTMKEEIT